MNDQLAHRLAPQSLGTLIKQARQAKGWSQDKLARVLEVTTSNVRTWEKDHYLPSLSAFARLVDALEIDPAVLLHTVLANETPRYQEDPRSEHLTLVGAPT